MLALGIQTRVVAALMVIEMIAAAYVHAPTFSWADRGMEMPLLMGLVAGSTSRFAVQGAEHRSPARLGVVSVRPRRVSVKTP